MRRLLDHRSALYGVVLLVLLVAAVLSTGVIAQALGTDSTTLDLAHMLAGPSFAHPLGTDDVGRDVLLRLLEGGQVSLLVGAVTAVLAGLLGTLIGITAGYLGGAVDALLMRITDGVIALPLLPLLIVLGALDPAKLGLPPEIFQSEAAGVARIALIIALVGWTSVARLVRAATLSVRVQDYVRAAEALGARPYRIMLRHVLPNVASPLIVATALSIGNIVLTESALSFLGLGVQQPLPSWGNMLSSAIDQMSRAPVLAVWPGLLILLTVLACNLIADGLQDALDPHGATRRQ